MSHKHLQLVRLIFLDPPASNLQWREIESLLHHVGAEVENIPGARVRVKINRMEAILHRPHHSNTLDRQGVKHLREFLARAGITVSAMENQ